MKCKNCGLESVFDSPNYCKDHFNDYFEEKVKKTIKDHKLISKKDRVVVAASGGKDSMAVLHILKKQGYSVSALCIDEGIKGYRDGTIKTLSEYCKKKDVPLNVVSFVSEFKKTLDMMLKKDYLRPCTVCGIYRRKLLNKFSQDFDVLATGHNLDDEAQAVFMNLVKGNTTLLLRQGPVSGNQEIKGLTKRIKPLFFLTEKEIRAYSFLNGITTDFSECPNVSRAFRLKIRDFLNEMENNKKGTKKNIINWFMKNISDKKTMKKTVSRCELCKSPCSGKVCSSCKMEI